MSIILTLIICIIFIYKKGREENFLTLFMCGLTDNAQTAKVLYCQLIKTVKSICGNPGFSHMLAPVKFPKEHVYEWTRSQLGSPRARRRA